MKNNIKRIVLVGGGGNLGDSILTETLKRGYNVIAVVANASTVHINHPLLEVIEEESIDDPEVSDKLSGNKVMISAFEPSANKGENEDYVSLTQSVIDIAKNFGFEKVIATGYHSTINSDGSKRCTPYPFVHQISQAQKDARHLFEEQKSLSWSYVHASRISSGMSYKFHKGDRFLLLARRGSKRKLPIKSYASALIDEVERKN